MAVPFTLLSSARYYTARPEDRMSTSGAWRSLKMVKLDLAGLEQAAAGG
jgi:hypothetical protein